MNLLVTLNGTYIHALQVMLTSLFINDSTRPIHLYLMNHDISEDLLEKVRLQLKKEDSFLHLIKVNENTLQNAPVKEYLTREMYFRLLAPDFLPLDIERILYLDPDILVLNPLKSLYNMELKHYCYAASFHNLVWTKQYNRIRLYPYKIDQYFNSGVLLMNLNALRHTLTEDKIIEFITRYKKKLILPDQDIMNALYANKILPLDEKVYNYDAHQYLYYFFRSYGKLTRDEVEKKTVIMHFNGKTKPWHEGYKGIFLPLFKHYEQLTLKNLKSTELRPV